MGFKCGIVGLPNVGKSTLFNALTQTAAAQAANYPFCTIEPNVGDVAVPDPRLAILAEIAGSKEIIPTRLTFVDIAGLVRGASKGEGLGNQFLANIRECDAIAHVVRCFEDGDVTHVEGRIDPLSDIETIETELMLADLESLERRIAQMEKRAKGGDKDAKDLLALAERSLAELQRGPPGARRRRRPRRAAPVPVARPAVVEAGALCLQRRRGVGRQGQRLFRPGREQAAKEGAAAVVVSAKIESEIAVLPQAEQKAYPGGGRADRARPQPRDPRRLRPSASRHLLHRRAEGGARLDGREGRQGARRRPASSTPISRRASSAPRPSPTTITSPTGRSGRARGRQVPARRQGLCGRRRRRDAFPLRQLSAMPDGLAFEDFPRRDRRVRRNVARSHARTKSSSSRRETKSAIR